MYEGKVMSSPTGNEGHDTRWPRVAIHSDGPMTIQ